MVGRSSRVTRQDLYLALFIVALGLVVFLLFPPGMTWLEEQSLDGPFEPVEGCVYRLDLRAAGLADIPNDANGTLVDSRLEILEDGELLGPAHTNLSDIGASCDGAFAHLQYGLFLSASDGSDPSSNGHTYTWRVPQALPAMAHVPVLVLMQILTAFLLFRLLGRGRLLSVAQVALLLLTVQVAVWTVIENDLADRGEFEQFLYRAAFDDALQSPQFRFAPHHTLNYALNPLHERAGVRQHDPDYLIRRNEPLRSGPHRTRVEEPLRLLVLGGSTTYDNAILREQDTWVYRLEEHLRALCGPEVEVINGGVGGYTLYENLLHYVSHLRHLDADVLLVFTGINDVQPRLVGTPRPDYGNYRAPWREAETVLPSPNRWLAFLTPYRFYYLRRVALPGRHRRIGQEARAETPPVTRDWVQQLEETPPVMYRSLLEDLVRLAQARGTRVVIVPQYFTPRTPRDESFAVGVREHNEVGRQVAAAFGLPFFGEVLEPDAFSLLDTVDNCHFTHRGAGKMARLVYQALLVDGVLDGAAKACAAQSLR